MKITKGKNLNPKKNSQQPVIIQQVSVKPINRQSQDLTNWRNAMRAAEASVPRRVTLYDLYFDILLDGHLSSVWQKRIDAVTSAEWQFTDKDGKPVDEINELIDSIGFEDLLTEIVNSRAWGYTMVEPTFFINRDNRHEMSLYLIPRKHMRPDKGIVAHEQTGDTGINIREGIYADTVLEAGKADDLGLFLKVAQYVILKRGNISDWAEFIQIFGRGIIDATWDGFDDKQRIQLADSIEQMGSGGVIIRPVGTTIEVKQPIGGNATGQLQEGFASFMNKEISKAILGTTETTESSKTSGYAQSETHQKEDDKKNESDITFSRRILNSRFTPILKAAGFDTRGGTFVLKSKKKLSKKESFEIHKSMVKDLNIPVSDDFFYEEYEMPKPEKYEALKKEKEQTKQQQQSITDDDQQPGNNKQSKKKKAKLSYVETQCLASQKSWFQKLFDFFVPAPKNGAMTRNNCCGNLHTLNLPKTNLSNNDIVKQFWDAKGELFFCVNTFSHTAQTLIDAMRKGWQNNPVQLTDIGFEYGVNDPALLTAFEQNLFRFSAAKTLAQAQELNKLFREAKSYEEFEQKANQLLDKFNTEWLRTEYNTAYLCGEAAATYNRLKSQVDTFPYWEYKTVGDNRVRPQHRALNGLILPANDPRWKKIFPPNDWNCRCYIVPRMKHEVTETDIKAMRARCDAYFGTEEFKQAQAQGWGVNRAETGEIFTANQFYIKKFPNKAAKILDGLLPQHYELQSYSNAKKAATEILPKYSGTADKFLSGLEKVNGIPAVRDYNNRPLSLTQKNFKQHTTGKRAYRVEYLNALKETLKQPDEVWINSGDQTDTYDRFITIKYYKNETIIVLSGMDGVDIYEVLTWFPLSEQRKVIDKYRRGLLIFNR